MSDTKLKWHMRYNCHQCVLSPGLSVAVNWGSKRGALEPWDCFVFGDLVGTAKEFSEGEDLVISIARQRLRKALANLPAASAVEQPKEESPKA
jgi:hypothetical protein